MTFVSCHEVRRSNFFVEDLNGNFLLSPSTRGSCSLLVPKIPLFETPYKTPVFHPEKVIITVEPLIIYVTGLISTSEESFPELSVPRMWSESF